jgi:hypothetical protein
MSDDSAADRVPASEAGSPVWATWPDERLLDLRFSDLGIAIDGSVLEERIATLNGELDARGIRFKPHFWLSSEWFTPDTVAGVAIPFYLAHPRLARLELTQMLEVEGGDPEWCMQILRHETGHALDNAYNLRRLRTRQKLFGPSSQPYPDYYTPKPYSRSYVQHLEAWYAQSHPDEDFAETFAIWLTPDSMWRERFAGWPALKKLEYMDRLMRRVAASEPVRLSRRTVEPVGRLRKTLRAHYRERRRHYEMDYPDVYDRDLMRLFSNGPEAAGGLTAARFLGRIRKDVRRAVARWTGTYQYTIDQVLEDMIGRCRELNLRLTGPEDRARQDFTILLTVHALNYLHSGRHRLAL